jgi:hypothetical protein
MEVLHLYQSVWWYWGPTSLAFFVLEPFIDERYFLPDHGNRGNFPPFLSTVRNYGPLFSMHIGNYLLSNGPQARK